MTESNSSDSEGGGGDGVEVLAPLLAAQPLPPTGRIRSLEEARRALRVPTAPTREVLQAWGVPNQQLVAFQIGGDASADLVAEFAALLVLRRDGGHLQTNPAGTPLRLAETGNALWIVYGSIVKAVDEALVLGALSLGPAFDLQTGERGNDAALGVTAELLRLLSPTKLLSQTIEYLERPQRLLAPITSSHEEPDSDERDASSEKSDRPTPPVGRARRTAITEELLAEMASRYVTLYRRGQRQPLPQLAREFGITRSQARDRIHRARQQGWLEPGRERRAGGEPGRRLIASGWKPPEFEADMSVSDPGIRTESRPPRGR